jgi:ATP-dependent helicase HrpA
VERQDIKAWDFGDLPAQITFNKKNSRLTGYPALVDEKDSVSIKLFDAEQPALRSMRAGVLRLLRFSLKEQLKQLDKGPENFNQLALQLRSIITPDQLKEDWLNAVIDRAFIGDDDLPRDEKAFEQQKQRARTRLPAVSNAMSRYLSDIVQEYLPVQQKLNATGNQLAKLTRDIKQQLSMLIYPGFLSQTPWEKLQHIPRYLKAIRLRFEKYGGGIERDERHRTSIERLQKLYEERKEKHRMEEIEHASLMEFRWLIEELRVSLFAQELKTPMPVSIKRLEKIWESIPA